MLVAWANVPLVWSNVVRQKFQQVLGALYEPLFCRSRWYFKCTPGHLSVRLSEIHRLLWFPFHTARIGIRPELSGRIAMHVNSNAFAQFGCGFKTIVSSSQWWFHAFSNVGVKTSKLFLWCDSQTDHLALRLPSSHALPQVYVTQCETWCKCTHVSCRDMPLDQLLRTAKLDRACVTYGRCFWMQRRLYAALPAATRKFILPCVTSATHRRHQIFQKRWKNIYHDFAHNDWRPDPPKFSKRYYCFLAFALFFFTHADVDKWYVQRKIIRTHKSAHIERIKNAMDFEAMVAWWLGETTISVTSDFFSLLPFSRRARLFAETA